MRAITILGLIAGLVLTTILVVSNGAAGIWHSSALVGLSGFAILTGFHLGLIALMGTALWLLTAERNQSDWPCFVWGRLVRDSGSEVLPLSQIGGYVLGARAVTLTGVKGAFAAASTVVDVTVELIAQLAYTLCGLLLLDKLRPDAAFVHSVLIGLVAMSILAAIFMAVQAHGAGWRMGTKSTALPGSKDAGSSPLMPGRSSGATSAI